MRKLDLCALALLFLSGFATMQAQVSLIPTFVTQNDTVEVLFDATQGNAELVGVSQVYAHTGVITSASTGPTDWRYVQGNWGTADAKVQMTNLGNNQHSLKYHINTFYSVPAGETVQSLAFVFRNQDGSKVGRASGGGDIFVPIYSGGLQAIFSSPAEFGVYDLNDTLELQVQTSTSGTITLFHETTQLTQVSGVNSLNYDLPLVNYGQGRFEVILQAVLNGNVIYDTISYLARSGPNIGVDPHNGEEGITVLNDSTVYLKLRAPFKSFIYVVGDFNDWEVDPQYEMFKTPDSKYFWLEITGLDSQTEYGFQYHIDQEGLRIGDPYAEKVLDPWNDPYIPSSVYPNLKPFPVDRTNYPVSVFQIDEPDYTWQTGSSYQRPEQEDLVVYELLIRDFDERRTYQSVIDRLPYLTSLGVNAIELMPVMEFEGNESWGYNPMFFMAPDKYYGTKNDLKMLIDSCHQRGIAVIMDIVLNHAFGLNSMVRMYFDASSGQPTAQNPWFNQVPKHEFNVGYDFNHESEDTKYFARRVLQHWVSEYKIDGYRFDLSKGLTQKNTLGNVAAMAQYDQSRINIISRLKNDVHQIDPGAYIILEHFADNPEEVELASRGFMLWGNENHQYNEATMGYSSNLSGVYHANRNFASKHLVGYMESHDEERLMFKNSNYGNGSGSYSVKNLATGLDRVGLAAAFFFTVPGPKMIWQFGEMGYDFSINYCPDGTIDPGCRIANKPVHWDYLNNPDRADLVNEFSALIWLRRQHPNVFENGQLSANWNSMIKHLLLSSGDSSALIVGNFNVTQASVNVAAADGVWYDYFGGDSIVISGGSLQGSYAPGEYHIYTNFKTLSGPATGIGNEEWIYQNGLSELFPNPASGHIYLKIYCQDPVKDLNIELYNITGQQVRKVALGEADRGWTTLEIGEKLGISELGEGIYLYHLRNGKNAETGRILVQH